MIDIENEVYTVLATALRADFSGIYITGKRLNAPTEFPCVSIIETDNYTSPENMDSSDKERFASLLYEVNVYSNKTATSKSECKAILATIDPILYSMNFTRTVVTPVDMEDTNIYRIVARYTAKTDGNHIFRR